MWFGQVVVIRLFRAFNSLSRDHGYRLDVGFYEILLELSTPSLGITACNSSCRNTAYITSFNSLSRDHTWGGDRPICFEPACFQLPLSGSPAESYEG